MKKEYCYYKEVKLDPTHFCLDVWVCNSINLLSKYFNKQYGESVEYYKSNVDKNQVCNIVSKTKSILKGEKRIVMNIYNWNNDIIVHESSHVVFHIAEICGLSIDYNSQEWFCYMLEYINNNCNKKEGFKKLKNI